MNNWLIFSVWCSVVILASSEDSLTIPQVPESIEFSSTEALKSSDVADILSGFLAFTVSKNVKWQSLDPVNPLKRPEAIYVLNIIGATKELSINGPSFPLDNNANLDDQYYTFESRVNQRFANSPDGKPLLIKMDAGDKLYSEKSEHVHFLKSMPAEPSERLLSALDDSELQQGVTDGTFNISREGDAEFLLEMKTIKLLNEAIFKNKVTLKDNVPDVYWVQIHGLNSVVQQQISDFQVKEANRILEQVISETVATVNQAYDGKAVVAVFTESSSISHSRQRRETLADPTEEPPKTKDSLNLAYFFKEDTHIAFALLAFVSVVLILSVFGISVAMWFIDPGRDSIIYRMTSTRMKKD